MVTWILVTNGSAGRLLKIQKNGQEIDVVKEFSHPQTAKKVVDTSSKTHGTTSHAVDYDGEIEQHERNIFAKELAEFLTKALGENKFDTLILVAPAKMLGEIRHESMHLLKRVAVYELHKDLLSQRLKDTELVALIKKDLDIPHL